MALVVTISSFSARTLAAAVGVQDGTTTAVMVEKEPEVTGHCQWRITSNVWAVCKYTEIGCCGSRGCECATLGGTRTFTVTVPETSSTLVTTTSCTEGEAMAT
ncbi:hypothetical protein LTR37_019305 [Vermiconidia calcicola]|uniref:Uncharacterized protein n=1 Tax=Vermiconidia calcicola TaxID=1690605 RepID=A0ACC3MEL0_9PEZI|nr:hypothetical protein LTR37_019305 [Vermiconidia calcicola]